MKQIFSKVPIKSWKKLINKLRYYKKECKKKDVIIKSLEEQLSTLRSLYVQ